MLSRCRALLVLNVLYCVLAVLEPGLPGWKMFERVDAFAVTLRDRAGQTIALRDYLPRDAYVTDYGEMLEVVAFVCQKEIARAPLVFEERVRGVRRVLGPGGCRVDMPGAPR